MLQRTVLHRMHLFRRAVVREHGGPNKLILEDFNPKQLQLGSQDVLVRNSFAGVNYLDTYFRTGLYKKPTMPFVAGEEGSGAIVAVGDGISKSRLGERVAYCASSSGSYSSFTVVPARDAFTLPADVPDSLGAAALLQGCTAHYLTRTVFPAASGRVVLIHAIAGGTGLLVSQLCKQAGATVIGICGTEDKATMAREVGKADHVLVRDPNWVQAVRDLTGGRGVHCVYDGVGKATFAGSLQVLRRQGTMVSFGNASGAVDPVPLSALTSHGSIALHRPTLRDYMHHDGGEAAWRVKELLDSVAKKELTLTVGKVFRLQEAVEAHEYLESRASSGKILINCQE